MGKGLNQCNFMGRIGADPELRSMQSGAAKLTFRIAVDESYTDRDGKKHESVSWIPIVAWGKQAEGLAQYLKKGSQVMVVTRFSSRTYEDPNTREKKYAYDFVLVDLVFGASAKGEGGQASQNEYAPQDQGGGGGGYRRGGGGNSGGGQQRQAPAPQQQAQAPAEDFQDDLPPDSDIPF